MNVEALIPVLTGAIVLSAISMVAQAIFAWRMSKKVAELTDRLNRELPRALAFFDNAEKTLQETRQQLNTITTRTSDILGSAQVQLQRVDEIMADASVRVRAQLQRMELVLDDSVGRVHQTVVTLNNGIMWPIKEVHGVASGLKAAVTHLVRSGRPTVDRATADEEMFI